MRMIGHFQSLLEGIVSDPEQRLFSLPLLSEPERHQLLVEWNELPLLIHMRHASMSCLCTGGTHSGDRCTDLSRPEHNLR